MDDSEQRSAHKKEAFTESANVTDPIKQVVHLSINDVQV